METIKLAGYAGRCAGVACRTIAAAWQLIDWQEVAAIVGHGLIVLAVMTFHAGRETGAALHRLNGALATLWRRLWLPPVKTAAPVVEAPCKAAHRPMVHPLAELAEPLHRLSCRELRGLSGVRAKRAKVWLVAAYVAA